MDTRQTVPIKAQLEVLAELMAEGKIRAIGLSNEHPWGVMQFIRHAEEFGFVASTIVGASTFAQLQENLAACEMQLDKEVLTEIDRLYLTYGSPAP
ncbi:hypothetical protein MASR1M60_07590 [Rhodocyclaceae bacterium]